jgi:hypothetical protein
LASYSLWSSFLYSLRFRRNILASVLERNWEKALAALRESIEEWKRLFVEE